MRMRLPSLLWRSDAQAIAVGIDQVTFARSGLLFNADAELFGDGVNVAHAEIDQRVGPRIALVLRKKEAHAAPRHATARAASATFRIGMTSSSMRTA
jgi:hypothetical protein